MITARRCIYNAYRLPKHAAFKRIELVKNQKNISDLLGNVNKGIGFIGKAGKTPRSRGGNAENTTTGRSWDIPVFARKIMCRRKSTLPVKLR